ncbi:unnamed protein product [Parajaminaea phylloscopi]
MIMSGHNANALQQETTAQLHSGDLDNAAKTLDILLGAGSLGIPALDLQRRRALTQTLLDTLSRTQMPSGENKQQSPSVLRARRLALQALKELSRLPGGSNIQSEPTGMKVLLAQISLPSPPAQRPKAGPRRTSGSSGITSDGDADPAILKASPPSSFSSAFSRAWQRGKGRARSVERKGPHTSDEGPCSASTEPTPSLPSTDWSSHQRASTSSSMTETSAVKEARQTNRILSEPDWESTDIALRCLNNALYLHEVSRLSFAEDTVGGARKAVKLLHNPQDTPADIIFLAARLLFYATLFESSFNRVAVEEENIVVHLAECLNVLTAVLRSALSGEEKGFRRTESPAQIKAALSELLKTTFNLGLYYPRIADGSSFLTAEQSAKAIVGEQWHEELAPLFKPIAGLLLSMSPVPLAQPTTQIVGVLLNFPVSMFQQSGRSQSWSSPSQAGPTGRQTPSPRPSTATRVAKAFFAAPKLQRPRTRSGESSPAQYGSSRDLQSTSTKSPSAVTGHLTQVLSVTLERYFPPNARAPASLDIDDASVRVLARADGMTDLEDVIQPLCLLLRKLAAEDEALRIQIKGSLLPDNIDRSIAPDKRMDSTGRLIRLMGSLSYPRLARASGEVLLALCRSDPSQMVSEIGYGPCAGWLVSNGYGMPVPNEAPSHEPNGSDGPRIRELRPEEANYHDQSAQTANSHGPANARGQRRTVNPITGSYEADGFGDDSSLPPMSDEEKEAEASRLFDLFDRLNRTGVVKVPHPVRSADPEKLREVEEQERQQRETLEIQEEEEALRDLAAYKSRKLGRAGAP